MTASLINAIADVIDATGFHAMARDYRSKPEYRSQIERAMVRNIRNDRRAGGPEVAAKLERMINEAKRAA